MSVRDLCIESEVTLPFTREKSPQWLVKAQDTTEDLRGSSFNFALAISPLNIKRGSPTRSPSSSNRALYTYTSRFTKAAYP